MTEFMYNGNDKDRENHAKRGLEPFPSVYPGSEQCQSSAEETVSDSSLHVLETAIAATTEIEAVADAI